MDDYSIIRCEIQPDLVSKISPNFIYNRFDLWDLSLMGKGEVSLWDYRDNEREFYFEVLVTAPEAKLGLWLVPLDSTVLSRIIKMIFREYRIVKMINMENARVPAYGRSIPHNHFRIEFPETVEGLDHRLSSKGRYNLKREKRILKETFGSYSINHYDSLSPDTIDIWNFYFEMKYRNQGTKYGLTMQEYCKKYHVSDIYTLSIGENNRLAAVFLSCEQCPIIYLENLTYDATIGEYSPGKILYDEYLKLLVQKKAKGIYLLGGDYSYKKHYGSIEDDVYNNFVYRNELLNLIKWAELRIRRIGHQIKVKVLSRTD